MTASRRRIAAAVRLSKQLMPADGNLPGLIERLGRRRGRPLHLLTHAFGDSPVSGLWIPVRNADYIVVDDKGTPSRRSATICHELAHVLLGHQPDLVGSAIITALTPDLSPALIARALARHSYDSRIESEAEVAATLIGAEHARRQGTAAANAGHGWSTTRVG